MGCVISAIVHCCYSTFCAAGLQYSLPALVTGMLKRGVPLERTVAWWAERPAALANLHKRKGRLAPGFDADIVVLYCMEMCCTTS